MCVGVTKARWGNPGKGNSSSKLPTSTKICKFQDLHRTPTLPIRRCDDFFTRSSENKSFTESLEIIKSRGFRHTNKRCLTTQHDVLFGGPHSSGNLKKSLGKHLDFPSTSRKPSISKEAFNRKCLWLPATVP